MAFSNTDVLVVRKAQVVASYSSASYGGDTDTARGLALDAANTFATAADAIHIGPGRFLMTASSGSVFATASAYFGSGVLASYIYNTTGTELFHIYGSGISCQVSNLHFDQHAGGAESLLIGNGAYGLVENCLVDSTGDTTCWMQGASTIAHFRNTTINGRLSIHTGASTQLDNCDIVQTQASQSSGVLGISDVSTLIVNGGSVSGTGSDNADAVSTVDAEDGAVIRLNNYTIRLTGGTGRAVYTGVNTDLNNCTLIAPSGGRGLQVFTVNAGTIINLNGGSITGSSTYDLFNEDTATLNLNGITFNRAKTSGPIAYPYQFPGSHKLTAAQIATITGGGGNKVEGEQFYDTTNHHSQVWNGSALKQLDN